MSNRRVNDEIKHGHPGFPYHQVTTEDLTQSTERFILRPVGCGCWWVDYRPGRVKVAKLNDRRTRFGRWIERKFYR